MLNFGGVFWWIIMDYSYWVFCRRFRLCIVMSINSRFALIGEFPPPNWRINSSPDSLRRGYVAAPRRHWPCDTGIPWWWLEPWNPGGSGRSKLMKNSGQQITTNWLTDLLDLLCMIITKFFSKSADDHISDLEPSLSDLVFITPPAVLMTFHSSQSLVWITPGSLPTHHQEPSTDPSSRALWLMLSTTNRKTCSPTFPKNREEIYKIN